MAPAARALVAEKSANQYYPLDTKEGAGYYELLSGPTVPAGLRRRMGQQLHANGHLKAPEFARAEARLKDWPRSPWFCEEVTPEDCHEHLTVRYRSAIVCFADTIRNPALDPTKDCVWGPEHPEVVTDEVLRAQDPHGIGYVSDVCHGQMCARCAFAPPCFGLTTVCVRGSDTSPRSHNAIIICF